MDLYKIISELRQLLKQVEAAIATLETLETGRKCFPLAENGADLQRMLERVQEQRNDRQPNT